MNAGGMVEPCAVKLNRPAKINPCRARQIRASLTGLLIFLAAGCNQPPADRFQGYIEGEFVYVSSPLAGQLEKLAVVKGAQVEVGAPLFSLERKAELAAQAQAAHDLQAAQARLEDLKKGSCPSEIGALEARLREASAAENLSKLDLGRSQELFTNRTISASEFDRARLNHERDVQAVSELNAQLETARLGGRTDAIAAAEAQVNSAESAKAKTDWNVNQKSQSAPQAGLVYDTLYREGEFVTAGNPVVSLLPPTNIKVRFYVPEGQFAALHQGNKVKVVITGQAQSLEGAISYLSQQPEYTPPVLYNRENRAKLTFMVEAVFDPAVAKDLHPGQPVDVSLVH